MSEIQHRRTHDFIEMIGNVGGSKDFLWLFIGLFCVSFSRMNYTMLIANKFYTWKVP